MVDTVRILDTFLDLGLFFYTKDLGSRSTDMLLSLLTSESMHESSSSSPPSSLWTRFTFENLTPGLDWLTSSLSVVACHLFYRIRAHAHSEPFALRHP
jgi:hypothetical protein